MPDLSHILAHIEAEIALHETRIAHLRTPIAHRGAQGWPFLPPEVEAQVWAAV